jgi:hypothetical protein
MRTNLKNSINRIIKKDFDMFAGKLVVLVTEEGVEKDLLTIGWTMTEARAEGLEVFIGGTEDQEERIIFFLRSYLLAQDIPRITSSMYFKIDGVRWDLRTGEPIAVQTTSSADTDNVIQVVLRKAVEREHTRPGSRVDFDLGCQG